MTGTRASAALTVALTSLACGRTGYHETGGDPRGACVAWRHELSIDDDLDDGEIGAGLVSGDRWYPSGEPQDRDRSFIGVWGGQPLWGYFRFALPAPIAAGATVVAAGLTLTSEGAGDVGWDPAAGNGVRVHLQDAEDAGRVASEDDFPGPPGMPLLPSDQRWPAAGGLAWPAIGGEVATPELSPMFDELLGRHTLAAGAHVQLWLEGTNFSDDREVAFQDFNRFPAAPARLLLEVACP